MRDHEQNPYLEQEVLTASPARLRWLLIQKAAGVCQVVQGLWREQQTELAAQWLIRVRDLLNELLAGVQGQDPLAKQVADLYVYMLTLLTRAEIGHDPALLGQLQSLLEIELETWSLVQQQLSGGLPAQSAGTAPAAQSVAVPPAPLGLGDFSASEGSLCLDA
jgi:flagellar secretion chaperone FliS